MRYATSLFQAVFFGTVMGIQIDMHLTGSQSLFQTHITAQQQQQKHHNQVEPIIIKDLGSVHQRSLLICNAYAHPSGLHIYNLGTEQRITDNEPLAYKACMEKKINLREDDKLDFHSNRRSIGVFRARGLPQSQSSLLLVPYRRDPNSIRASFDSHAFMDRDAPQVVVIDAYRGSQVGKIKILETSINQTQGGAGPQEQAEDLQFKSVISVNPGQYQILLQNASDTSVSSTKLKIDAASGKYVVMRVGCEPDAHSPGYKPAFPQEVVVFPQISAALALQFHGLVLFSSLALAGLGLFS